MQSVGSHRRRGIRRRNNAGQRDRRFLRLAGPLSKLLKAGKPARVSTESGRSGRNFGSVRDLYSSNEAKVCGNGGHSLPLSLSLYLSLSLSLSLSLYHGTKGENHRRWLSASEETFLEMQIGSARRHSRRHGWPS